MKQYVQHISGQGEKWKLRDCEYNENSNRKTWVIDAAFDISSNCMELPRSEYKICTPPEEWEDITRECEWTHECYDSWYIKAANGDRIEAYMNGPYRVRKIDLLHAYAFIVERRKP